MAETMDLGSDIFTDNAVEKDKGYKSCRCVEVSYRQLTGGIPDYKFGS